MISEIGFQDIYGNLWLRQIGVDVINCGPVVSGKR